MPNVKAGDTAYVVGLPVPMLHTFVHVERLAARLEYLDGIVFVDDGMGGIAWVCTGHLRLSAEVQSFARRTELRNFVMHDKHLRPIRDPGDDAKDETLLWLPVPPLEKPKQQEKSA